MCRVLGVSVTATKSVLKTRVADALQDKGLTKKRKREVTLQCNNQRRSREIWEETFWEQLRSVLLFCPSLSVSFCLSLSFSPVLTLTLLDETVCEERGTKDYIPTLAAEYTTTTVSQWIQIMKKYADRFLLTSVTMLSRASILDPASLHVNPMRSKAIERWK